MEHSIYLNGLKKALKSRDLSYRDLAVSLRMTESGVKKMLNAKDISFRRVLQICDILNVLPGQLFSLSEQSSIPVLPLTSAQEEALIRDRTLLAAYWLFAIDRLTPEEITVSARRRPRSESRCKSSSAWI
ncbi:MAG TPA: helix-turn-helix transcriptional regulator [Pseudobdellovibrionaceae bacterium]|nr:helix-turn-helix transcriptional regulator [Pseudobdellovibrionaceae bacterium]